jgi:hypothetical protein
MNDFSELEQQLRNLRPVQPSSNLMARIERALADPESSASTAGVLPRERRFYFNWFSLGLGLAAATALVMFAYVRFERPPTKAPAVAVKTPTKTFSSESSNAQFVPVGLTQVIYSTRDEGLHFPGNSDRPVRRVRSEKREVLQWRNPKTGASLRISYPSEEVSLVPVTGQ